MSADLEIRTRCPDCRRSIAYSRRHPPRCCPYCNEPLELADTRETSDGDENYVLFAGTQADDGNPYAVVGKKPPPLCPECNATMTEADPVCPQCNMNRTTGRRVPKSFAPFDQTWEAGFGLKFRLIGFGIFQVVNVVMFFLIDRVIEDVPATLGGWFLIALLQAFLLGTFDRVRIQRTTKGKVTITKTWRVGFIPIKPTVLTWRGLEEVGVRRDDVGLFEWLIFLLLLCDGIVPGILWWWFAIRTDRHAAVLMKDMGAVEHTLYAGTDENKAEEIARTVHDLTGLPYRAVS